MKYEDQDYIQRRRLQRGGGSLDNTPLELESHDSEFGEFKEDGQQGAGNSRAAAAAIQSVGSSQGMSGVGKAGAGLMAAAPATGAASPYVLAAGAALSTADAINQGKKREGEKREMKKLQRIQRQQQALSRLTDVSNGLRRL